MIDKMDFLAALDRYPLHIHENDLETTKAALRIAAGKGWRTMDDKWPSELKIDIWDKVNDQRYTDCMYDDSTGRWYDRSGFVRYPSHWRLAPAAPPPVTSCDRCADVGKAMYRHRSTHERLCEPCLNKEDPLIIFDYKEK